ncbi:MAG TPA: hypothetical protein VIH52_02415 [Candidatus Nanoarchaeia archaeon]
MILSPAGLVPNLKTVRGLITFLILLNIVLIASWLVISGKLQPTKLIEAEKRDYSEIAYLQGKDFSFQELSNYFTQLAYSKGAEYAYEVLKITSLPSNTDLHLLGHVVGDVLYKQQGGAGIKICTDDFRNACSHSIVVGLFVEKGEGSLSEITEACRQAPGGKGAYTMCFHGVGHGILAAFGYNLEKAVEICEKTEFGRGEFPECVGGAIMEITGGGFHDRELWSKQRPNYLKSDNPLYPCNSDLIPSAAKFMCYTYITPYLFEAVGANLGSPQPSDFEKAFAFCNQVPANEAQNRESCFGGFGKEFVVLAKSRDIRNVENMNDAELATVYQWCTLGKSEEAVSDCVVGAMHSIYWGGENKSETAVRFCSLATDQSLQEKCFTQLIGAVSYYIDDKSYRSNFCAQVPNAYQKRCQTNLNSN